MPLNATTYKNDYKLPGSFCKDGHEDVDECDSDGAVRPCS